MLRSSRRLGSADTDRGPHASCRSYYFHVYVWTVAFCTALLAASHSEYRAEFGLCFTQRNSRNGNPINWVSIISWVIVYWAASLVMLVSVWRKLRHSGYHETIATRHAMLKYSITHVVVFSVFWGLIGLLYFLLWLVRAVRALRAVRAYADAPCPRTLPLSIDALTLRAGRARAGRAGQSEGIDRRCGPQRESGARPQRHLHLTGHRRLSRVVCHAACCLPGEGSCACACTGRHPPLSALRDARRAPQRLRKAETKNGSNSQMSHSSLYLSDNGHWDISEVRGGAPTALACADLPAQALRREFIKYTSEGIRETVERHKVSAAAGPGRASH